MNDNLSENEGWDSLFRHWWFLALKSWYTHA